DAGDHARAGTYSQAGQPRIPPQSQPDPVHGPENPGTMRGVSAVNWIASRGGVVHRQQLIAAGIDPAALRPHQLNRAWFATDSAPPALVAAARVSGRVACVTAAAHVGLALLHS